VTPERWAKVTEIFQASLEVSVAERRRFLSAECGDDADLRTQVESLLSSHELAEEQNTGQWNAARVIIDSCEPSGRIGPYEVLGKIGSGGMAEVYRVRDERLGREVALKMLLPELAGDDEFVERFWREARAASRLEHPNICRLYDVGEWQGRPYLTMELLEGQTLRERMNAGRIEIAEAATIAIEVADALAEAHSLSFVHRDIKPGNIFLTNEGQVKVLDFGLTKRMKSARQQVPEEITLTNPRTVPGTPSYMAPEQILGDEPDARTDTYALGTVLYEMISGRLPFQGENASDMFRRILSDKVTPASHHRDGVPQELDRIILRAIERDRDYRYQSALDLRAELRRLLRGSEEEPPLVRVVPESRQTWRWVVTAAAILAFAGALMAWRMSRAADTTAGITVVDASAGFKDTPAFSPDGDKLAYFLSAEGSQDAQIYVKLVEAGTAVRISKGVGNETMPVWSPDGKWIAFKRTGPEAGYYMAASLGGGEVKVADLHDPPSQLGGRSLDWSPDGQWILIADRMNPGEPVSIYGISPETREKKKFVEGGPFLANPVMSPDSRQVAYTMGSSFMAHDLYIKPLDGAARRITSDQRWIAGVTWTPDGKHLIFSSNRSNMFMLWKVHTRGGDPETLAAGPDAYSPAVSTDGSRIVYSRRRLSINLWRVSIENDDEPQRVIHSVRSSVEADYSPNGRRIAFTSDRRGGWDIWITDSDGGNMGRLVAGKRGQTGSPRWSPDGAWIAFASRPEGNSDIHVAASDGSTVRRVTTWPAEDSRPSWSRDGRFLYFISDRSGRNELWKVSALGGEPVQVTRNGAEFGVELEDGETLLYLNNGALLKRGISESAERRLATGVRDFCVRGDQIYFTPITHSMFNSIEKISVEGGGRSPVKNRIGPRSGMPSAITVSPDGRWILFDRIDQDESELLVLHR